MGLAVVRSPAEVRGTAQSDAGQDHRLGRTHCRGVRL